MLLLLAAVLLAAGCSDDNGTKPDSAVTPDGPGGADGPEQTDGPAACQVTSLLPADNAVGDFVMDGSPQTAANLTELTALINGGSEKYTQGGKFVCMALATYKSATQSHSLELWLFDQTDTAGAEAAYTATAHPDDQDTSPVIGDASRGHDNAIADVYQADMRKGQYLARVIADAIAGKDDAINLLRTVAGGI
jgi:hypothetical protein